MRTLVLRTSQRVDRGARILIAVTLGVSACFSDAPSPAPAHDHEQLVAGWYDGPLVARDTADTYLVAARRDTAGAEPRVVVFPISEPYRRCSIGGAHSGRGTLGGNGRPIIKILRPTEFPSDADLELYNGGCKLIAELPGVLSESVERVVIGDLPVGVAAEVRTGELIFLDIVTRRIKTLSTALSRGLPRAFEPFGGGDSRLWVVEPDQLLIIDTLGSDLTSVDATISEFATASDHAVFVNSGDLFSVNAQQPSPELVAGDACRPQLDAFRRSGEFVYRTTFLSPCSERSLVSFNLNDLTSQLVATDVETWQTYGEWIFFRTTGGDLFAWSHTDPKAVRVAGDATALAALNRDSFLIGIGEPEFSTLALFTNGQLEWLVRDVSDFVIGHDHVAVVSERSGPLGAALSVLDAGGTLVHAVPEGIDPTGIAFAVDAPELRYLVTRDGSRRLEVWEADSGQVKTIDTDVSGFVRQVHEPERGLVYAVTDPVRAGIWFAPLDW